jgi:hypothetical protein
MISHLSFASDGKPLDERLAAKWLKTVADAKGGRVTASLSDGFK